MQGVFKRDEVASMFTEYGRRACCVALRSAANDEFGEMGDPRRSPTWCSTYTHYIKDRTAPSREKQQVTCIFQMSIKL